MTFLPILASDTTAAFLLPVVILFWIGIGGGALAGVVALVLYGCKRGQRAWGVILGTLAIVAGAVGLLFLFVLTDGAGFWVWAGVLSPLAIGVLDVILWRRRNCERRVV